MTETKWVNWWCPPPSMIPTEYPAIVKKDSCYYVAYDLFSTYNLNLNRNLFVSLLEKCIEKPQIYLDTPYKETISYSAYTQEERTVVHIISNLAEKTNGDAPEIQPGDLQITGKIQGKGKVYQIYPEYKELTINTSDKEKTVVKLPKLTIHSLIIFE